jgi:hypothetical protein
MPRSQYLLADRPPGGADLELAGPAGTVCIVHYDMLHTATAKRQDGTRHMVKFLFCRMSEPSAPSWAPGAMGCG